MFTTQDKINIQLSSKFCMFDFDADVIAWSYQREQDSIRRHVEIVIDEEVINEYPVIESAPVDTIASHVFDEPSYTPVSFDEVLTQVGNDVDYTAYTVKELKEIAKSRGWKVSKMRRQELIDVLTSNKKPPMVITMKMLKNIAKQVRLAGRSKYKTKADLFSVLDKYFNDLGEESLIERLWWFQ